MTEEKLSVIKEIFKSDKQIERIYKGLVLIHTDLKGHLIDRDIDFNIHARSLEEKKNEIIKVYERLKICN